MGEDGIQNQDETDTDCGGVCPACETCEDGIQNQDETDTDCGGVCTACETCEDGIQNQDETGTDCGGVCTACEGCVEVKSVDHNSQNDGRYFNFLNAEVNSVLGEEFGYADTYIIDQYRNGQRFQEHEEVILWNIPNGGSSGDGHGRYNANGLTAEDGQWQIGDQFCFSQVEKPYRLVASDKFCNNRRWLGTQ